MTALVTAAAVAMTISACLQGEAEPIVRADASGPDAGPAVNRATCDPNAPLALYYRNGLSETPASAIDFLVKVQNKTGAPISLSDLAIRYYFVDHVGQGQTAVFYAGTCCGEARAGFGGDVHIALNAISPARGADHVLEITFDEGAGTLRDGDAVQIEASYFAPSHTQTFDPSGDYSFLAANTGTQAEWDACPSQCAKFESCVTTVQKSGVLVWGAPP